MTARLLLRLAVALTLVVLAAPRVSEAAEAAKSLPRLKVAENKRFLADESGRPFFWLADTAWQLLHDLGARRARGRGLGPRGLRSAHGGRQGPGRPGGTGRLDHRLRLPAPLVTARGARAR